MASNLLGCATDRKREDRMSTHEELTLAPQFEGLAAAVRALISEYLEEHQGEDLRRRMALKAAADVRSKTADAEMKSARDAMQLTVARTFGVPAGVLIDQ
jgi:hypothetical protein